MKASKRLLLVYDVPDWTWHRRAQDLQEAAPPEYTVDICCAKTMRRDSARGQIVPSDYDAVFAMSWAGAPLEQLNRFCRKVTLVTSSGPLYRKPMDADWNTWVTTGSRNQQRAADRLPKFDAVIAVNDKLFKGVRLHNPNTHHIPSAVNTEFYYPQPLLPWEGVLRVGWCGNPRGAHSVKGHDEVLAPLMRKLSDQPFKFAINTNNHRSALNREEMVAWYNSIDVLLCTSINEGTPSPIFEAAACFRLILSTDVGCVTDWQEPHDLGLVVKPYSDKATAHRTVERLAWKLNWLRESWSPSFAYNISSVLRQSLIERYSHRVIGPRYLEVIAGDAMPQ